MAIRVYIIDDNVMVRYALRELLSCEPDIKVVGDGSFYFKLDDEIEHLRPDVLLADIPRPREKGIDYLGRVNPGHIPVIVFTKSDDTMVKDLVPLLAVGAVAFVLKPQKDDNIQSIREEIVSVIRNQVSSKDLSPARRDGTTFLNPLRVVAIGSSTGGPEALAQILPQFPQDFPAGIVIVQHMPKQFTRGFAERLDKSCSIDVKEAEEGDIIKSGMALLAPGGHHLTFQPFREGHRELSRVRLNSDPPVWGLRPAVDKMMVSLAQIYKSNIIGVILTGMGQDGVVGMKAIKDNGGQTIVQNEKTSVVFGMAQEVIKNNLADEVWPLDKIVPRILEILKVNP